MMGGSSIRPGEVNVLVLTIVASCFGPATFSILPMMEKNLAGHHVNKVVYQMLMTGK